MDGAKEDKRREPEGIAIYWLALKIAGMVIDFSMNPELDEEFTSKGRLHWYAGISRNQMSAEQYRKTWKPYENLMVIALEVAIRSAGKSINEYKAATYKEVAA